MKKREYRDLYRRTMRDEIVGPRLFNDDEIDSFVQAARRQSTVRQRGISLSVRATAPNAAIIPLVDATYAYLLDPSIFRVNRVSLDGKPLFEASRDQFDSYAIERTLSRNGIPSSYYINEDRYMVLDRCFDVANGAVLRMEGYKSASPLVNDEDRDLEITDPDMQRQLMYYAYSLGYQMQDSEAEHIQKSQFFASQFDATFGKQISEDALRKQFFSGSKQTRYDTSYDGYAYRGRQHGYRR